MNAQNAYHYQKCRAEIWPNGSGNGAPGFRSRFEMSGHHLIEIAKRNKGLRSEFMGMNKSFLIILLFGLCGCVKPYNYSHSSYFATNNQSTESPIIYLKPVIEENKVHPVKEIIIKGLEKGSPAEQAGLQSGDRILTINGKTFETAEKFREYLDKSRYLKKDYWVVRLHNNSYLEKKITVKPEPDYYYSGLLHKYIDNEGKIFYPRYSSGNAIYQAGENYGMVSMMSYEGSLLVLVFKIINYSGKDLNFDKSQILLLDAQKNVLPILAQAKVVTQQYSDAMARNPMAALQLAPALMNVQNGADNAVILIPQGAKRSDKVYVLTEGVKLPVTARIKVEDETFEFQFN